MRSTPQKSFLQSFKNTTQFAFAGLWLLQSPAFGYISSRAGGSNTTNTSEENRAASTAFSVNSAIPSSPTFLTWSIVPDGSTLGGNTNSSFGSSELISALDAVHGVSVSDQINDLTARPWYQGIAEGLNLISKRSGVKYLYEPNDDGADAHLNVTFGSTEGEVNPGVLGQRGDLRIGGLTTVSFGAISSSSPASVYHPELFINVRALTSVSSLRFVTTHEAMHALGFNHSTVDNSSSLSSVTGVGGNDRGPQFDDICGLHRKYGDVYEKVYTNTPLLDASGSQIIDEEGNLVFTFDHNNNDIITNATDLGTADVSQPIIIGDDADDTFVDIDEFDFISIDDSSDIDFLKFTVGTTGDYALTLDPRGPTYINYNTDWHPTIREDRTQTIVADSLNDLKFELYNSSGSLIEAVSTAGLGESEILTRNLTAGTYYAKIEGTTVDPTQFAGSTTQVAGTQLYAFSVESTVNRPEADDLNLVTTAEVPVSLTLTGSDLDGDNLTFNIVTNPSNGVISGTAPALTYTPNAGFTGIETFTYEAHDGGLSSSPATVIIAVRQTPELLAGYDFDNGANLSALAVSVQNPYVSASDFGVGSGLGTPINTSGSALAENTDADGNILGTANPVSFGSERDGGLGYTRDATLTVARTVNDYLTMTFAPLSGAELNLFSFSFRAFANNLTESVNSWALYTSLDNFEAIIAQGTTSLAQTWVNHIINLSGDEFQGLTAPVELRLYIFNGRNTGSSLTLFDKFALNGSLSGLPTGYAAYVQENTGLTNTAFDADGNGNGIPNGIEYIFGNTSPLNGAIPITVDIGPLNTVFTFDRNTASTNDTIQSFQHSDDLKTWTTISLTNPNPEEVSTTSADNGIETISVTIDSNTNNPEQMFWRLKAEQIE